MSDKAEKKIPPQTEPEVENDALGIPPETSEELDVWTNGSFAPCGATWTYVAVELRMEPALSPSRRDIVSSPRRASASP